jgi:toxin FitB
MFAQRTLPITEDIMLKWRLVVEEGAHVFVQPDLIIAATALHHDPTVVTRDTADYGAGPLPGLQPVDRHCAGRE